jgi:threonine dehydratase
VNWAREIRAAEKRIRPIVRETPVDYSHALSAYSGAEVWLKLEHLQHTGSFKLRGAVNKMLSLTKAERRRGVIAASTGNHGMAVCYAARKLRTKATIYMAPGVAPVKLEMIRALGGHAVFHGTNPVDAEVRAREVSQQSGVPFISPYNDPAVIAGQGTLGMELDRQLDPLDAVFISVGGGGLIGGVAAYLKSVRPRVTVVGCWAKNSCVLYHSLRAGQIAEFPERPTISDGTAGGVEAGAITFPLCQELIGDCVLVSEAEILRAMKLLLTRERWLVEGAAGVAVAGLLKLARKYRGKSVAVVLCGRNIPAAKFRVLMAASG